MAMETVSIRLFFNINTRTGGLANVNDEHTFLEDGYQLVPHTQKSFSLNGYFGNNVELFPKIFFFFTGISGPLWVGVGRQRILRKTTKVESAWPKPLFCFRVPSL